MVRIKKNNMDQKGKEYLSVLKLLGASKKQSNYKRRYNIMYGIQIPGTIVDSKWLPRNMLITCRQWYWPLYRNLLSVDTGGAKLRRFAAWSNFFRTPEESASQLIFFRPSKTKWPWYHHQKWTRSSTLRNRTAEVPRNVTIEGRWRLINILRGWSSPVSSSGSWSEGRRFESCLSQYVFGSNEDALSY